MPNMQLLNVAGQNIEGMGHSETVELIQAAARPVVLKFRRADPTDLSLDSPKSRRRRFSISGASRSQGAAEGISGLSRDALESGSGLSKPVPKRRMSISFREKFVDDKLLEPPPPLTVQEKTAAEREVNMLIEAIMIARENVANEVSKMLQDQQSGKDRVALRTVAVERVVRKDVGRDSKKLGKLKAGQKVEVIDVIGAHAEGAGDTMSNTSDKRRFHYRLPAGDSSGAPPTGWVSAVTGDGKLAFDDAIANSRVAAVQAGLQRLEADFRGALAKVPDENRRVEFEKQLQGATEVEAMPQARTQASEEVVGLMETLVSGSPDGKAEADESEFYALDLDEQWARVAFFKELQLLQPLPGSELEEIAQVTRAHRYTEGELIIQQGDEATCMYFLRTGRADAEMSGQIVMHYEPGHFFGELGLFSNYGRAADVRSTAVSTCLVLDREDFHRLIGKYDHSGVIFGQTAQQYAAAKIQAAYRGSLVRHQVIADSLTIEKPLVFSSPSSSPWAPASPRAGDADNAVRELHTSGRKTAAAVTTVEEVTLHGTVA
jgi:hypothetical protein